MKEYISSTGEVFTDDDILRWAEDAENGFPNSVVQRINDRAWEAPSEVLVPANNI